jgi:hypothetical protein
MAIFYGDAVSMAANTATKLVDAAEVNRYVYLGGTLERLVSSSPRSRTEGW